MSGGNSTENSTAETFQQLPTATRKFLSGLREDDIVAMSEAFGWYNKFRTLVWFFKWLWIIIAAAFFGAIAIGEGVQRAVAIISNWKH